jgi:DNA transformation protein and related proteins
LLDGRQHDSDGIRREPAVSVSPSYRTFVLEQFGRCGLRVRARTMFGGVGLYADELFFALMADDALYLKVDDGNRPDFEARGLEPFRPYGEHGEVMSYFRLAEDLLEDPEELRAWADKAVAVARRARRPKSRQARDSRKGG